MEEFKDDLLKAEIERGYEIGESTARAFSITGEPYIELCGFGGRDGAMKAFNQYALGKHGALYWRVTPEVDGDKFYMRLLISDREPKKGAA